MDSLNELLGGLDRHLELPIITIDVITIETELLVYLIISGDTKNLLKVKDLLGLVLQNGIIKVK